MSAIAIIIMVSMNLIMVGEFMIIMSTRARTEYTITVLDIVFQQ